MNRRLRLASCAVLFAAAGCTVDFPFDPTASVDPLFDALRDAEKDIGDAIADPFDSRPFPVIVGGDSERIFYATSLTDVRINFPGPISDQVVQSFVGPSNLYEYANKQRRLIRPLIPSGAVAGIAADGRFLAYVVVADVTSDPAQSRLFVSQFGLADERMLFESVVGGAQFISPNLKLDAGRLAYVISEFEFTDGGSPGNHVGDTLFVDRLDDAAEPLAVDAEFVGSFDLRGDDLICDAQIDGVRSVLLLNVATGEQTTLSENPACPVAVALANNTAVWSETIEFGTQRAFAYDLATGERRVWADAVAGWLSGATDSHFLTEERVQQSQRDPVRLVVRRHDLEGNSKKLAEFRADGLAGQSQILGDRAVWVKPNRRVVTVPLAGGDRKSFAPF
jgi:hypothetical protein